MTWLSFTPLSGEFVSGELDLGLWQARCTNRCARAAEIKRQDDENFPMKLALPSTMPTQQKLNGSRQYSGVSKKMREKRMCAAGNLSFKLLMHPIDSALATFAIAAVVGLFAQVLSHRWRIPAIVPLLALGMLLGPSALDVLRPYALGGGLAIIVKLAVAVILFDGALNLRLGDLKDAAFEVRRLVTIGALVTWIGAASAAWAISGLSLPVAIVFGALLTVTGPTVVQPILRRVALPRRLKTTLEGEAILIDPVGAILAVAVVDIVLGLAGARPIGVIAGIWGYGARLIVGGIAGMVGGIAMSWLLRRRGWIPAELSNLVTLAGVWGVFAAAEWMQSESGIMAVVAMGLAMQRGAVPEERRLRQFKEQLTVLGISLLFTLLAANLPLRVIMEEGWRGIATVATLMFVVRPVSVWIALRGSSLSRRERMFIAWIAPRGVVAASVASLFAIQLLDGGFSEGNRVLALTFLTIAVTVTLQGLSANMVARKLGLQSLAGRRVIIVGIGSFSIEIAERLRSYGRPVTLIDRNEEQVARAHNRSLEVVTGNALEESVLDAAGAEEAETVIAITTNPEVNVLACHLAHDAFGVARSYPVLAHPTRGASSKLLERVGGRVAFGRPLDVRVWEIAFAQGQARTVAYRLPADSPEAVYLDGLGDETIAFARARDGSVEIATGDQTWRANDHVLVATMLEEGEATRRLDELVHARAGSAFVAG
jgi:NhaP-type Na+/H+ or K+/H+ antiporter